MKVAKRVLEAVGILGLLAGAGGIAWTGDWCLLLAFPVAFAAGIMRRTFRFGKWPNTEDQWFKLRNDGRIAFAHSLVSLYFCVYIPSIAFTCLSRMPNDFAWIKACWYAGLVIQPWLWRRNDAWNEVVAIFTFGFTVMCSALIVAFPKLYALWLLSVPLLLVVTLVIVHRFWVRRAKA